MFLSLPEKLPSNEGADSPCAAPRGMWFTYGVMGRRAIIELTVGGMKIGPLLLPTDEPVSLGRAAHCGIRVADPRLSNVFASLVPTELGWVLKNGQRTRVHTRSDYVLNGAFGPGAHVLLQFAEVPGWEILWDFDVLTRATVTFQDGLVPFRTARDKPAPSRAEAGIARWAGTLVAGGRVDLTPTQKRRMGALFAYLITGDPRPSNLAADASQRTDASPQRLINMALQIRDAINEHRPDQPLESMEDLGYHLVKVAQVIGVANLPKAQG